jgi:hypothetical protein
VGYLTFVGFDGSSRKAVNFCEATGAHRSSVNFYEPKVATDGSESISVSRPRRPQKLLNFSHPARHRLPVKLNLTPSPSTSRTPLHRPPTRTALLHRLPPGCPTAPATSVGTPALPPDPAAEPPPSRSSRAAARPHWLSCDACHYHHHRPCPRPPLSSDRPLLAAHRTPRRHPCSRPSFAQSRHCCWPPPSSFRASRHPLS